MTLAALAIGEQQGCHGIDGRMKTPGGWGRNPPGWWTAMGQQSRATDWTR